MHTDTFKSAIDLTSCYKTDKIQVEARTQSHAAFVTPNFLDNLLEKHSSFSTIIHIVSYVRRFVLEKFIPERSFYHGHITTLEFESTILIFIRHLQNSFFLT